MYVWQLSVNEDVYFGRTWEQLKDFLSILNEYDPSFKIFFVHNLHYEFHFIYSQVAISNVFARKVHHPLKFYLDDYNIEFRDTYILTNMNLANVAEHFHLPVKKQTGDLDYNLLIGKETPLTKKQLNYCEYDCLVLYHLIKYFLNDYETVDNIPLTQTGIVRRLLKEYLKDYKKHTSLVRNIINTDDMQLFNLELLVFTGGYVHSNFYYTDYVIKWVDSMDIASSYPSRACLSNHFPMSKFKKCRVPDIYSLKENFCYLFEIDFKNIKSKKFNNIQSYSKCRNIKNGTYDNGRLVQADFCTMYLTDVDLKNIIKFYEFSDYEIKQCYYSIAGHLPKYFIEFILKFFNDKTKLKGVDPVMYMRSKQMLNSVAFGMMVTNNIREKISFDGELWDEKPLTNKEIKEALQKEWKKAFLPFEWGLFITSLARNELLSVLDRYDRGYNNNHVVYCDTDSIKLTKGYDNSIIEEYNEKVTETTYKVAEELDIDINKFFPADKKGKKYQLGIFEYEGSFHFITKGAKKYATIKIATEKNKKDSGKLEITVSGVPKKGSKCLNRLEDFKDDLIFDYDTCGKLTHFFVENQKPVTFKDYQGRECIADDTSGISLMPCEYTLKLSIDYADFLEDSSKRSFFQEIKNEKIRSNTL